jgi:hypothetical protein
LSGAGVKLGIVALAAIRFNIAAKILRRERRKPYWGARDRMVS